MHIDGRVTLAASAIVDVAAHESVAAAAAGTGAWILRDGAASPLPASGPFAFHARGHRLLATIQGRGVVVDVASGRVLQEAPVRTQAVAWTSSGDPVWLGYEEVSRGGSAASSLHVAKGTPAKAASFATPYFRCFRPAITLGAKLAALWDESCVRIYETVPIRPLVALNVPPICVALSTKHCAVATVDALRLYDGKGTLLGEAAHAGARCIAFGEDGSTFLVGTERGVEAWTITEGRLEARERLELDAPVTALAPARASWLIGTERGEVMWLHG